VAEAHDRGQALCCRAGAVLDLQRDERQRPSEEADEGTGR